MHRSKTGIRLLGRRLRQTVAGQQSPLVPDRCRLADMHAVVDDRQRRRNATIRNACSIPLFPSANRKRENGPCRATAAEASQCARKPSRCNTRQRGRNGVAVCRDAS